MTRHRLVALFLTLGTSLLPGCRLEQAVPRARLAAIDGIVQEEIEAGHIPGAVVLVARYDRILYRKTWGRAVLEPYQEPLRKDAVFDLASLTKPVATAPSILVLADRGHLSVEDYVKDYLPAFACNGKEDARISHLLAHTSGLPAYTNAAALEKEHGSPCPDQVIEKICRLDAATPPGEAFRYSCLGYIILAEIVEVVSGDTVDDFSRENLFAPLGMRHTTYRPPASWGRRMAATEIVDDELLRGTVHDPLARLMGGVSGNAGLFSTARDLSIYCRMLLNGGTWKGKEILSPKAVEMLTAPQSHGRAYGFDIDSSYSWVKGAYTSKQAFCHTGYTGTSLVCDPACDTYVIILTNRAHPHDGGTSKPIRKKIADVVFQPYPDKAPF